MVFPGLALPEAFESLDSHLESVMSLCQLKGSTEAQAVGVVSICQELLRLLKCAFIGELRVKICSTLVKKCYNGSTALFRKWNAGKSYGDLDKVPYRVHQEDG